MTVQMLGGDTRCSRLSSRGVVFVVVVTTGCLLYVKELGQGAKVDKTTGQFLIGSVRCAHRVGVGCHLVDDVLRPLERYHAFGCGATLV